MRITSAKIDMSASSVFEFFIPVARGLAVAVAAR
jgi:hypothetical protein